MNFSLDALTMTNEQVPLPSTVKRRQTDLLTKINHVRSILHSGLSSSNKVLKELEEISKCLVVNDR